MINKAIIMGRLTHEPELRQTGTGRSVCSFSIAVNNGYGENQRTDFINCVAWNKTAEFVSRYFTKGKMIIVIGRITTRTWEDKNGKKCYATDVVADEVSFGESKGTANESKPSLSEAIDEGFLSVEPDDDMPFS